MKYIRSIIIVMLFFISCENSETGNLDKADCIEDYFYYSDNTKINIGSPILSEIWIAFEEDTVSKIEAENILKDYSFIEINSIPSNGNYSEILVTILPECDCDGYKNYLQTLNENVEIWSATPVFSNHVILLSEILTKPNENINHEEFMAYLEELGLELIRKTEYDTYSLKVKSVITGFESLEISNEIYENGEIIYVHPNMIWPVSNFPR